MQLQKRVSLYLLPIISVLVITLSFAAWNFIYEQSKRSEIERAWLSFEIILVDIQNCLSELESALTKIDGQKILSGGLAESEANELVDKLSGRLPGFKSLIIFDDESNRLTSLEEVEATSPGDDQMTIELFDKLDLQELNNKLYESLKKHKTTEGVMAFMVDKQIYVLASHLFSMAGEDFLMTILLQPFTEKNPYFDYSYQIKLNGPQHVQPFSRSTTSILHKETERQDEISANTSLFTISKSIPSTYIRQQISDFTLVLTVISISLILSLYCIVIYLLKRQIITPITRLEKKVNRSVRTGVLDIQPSSGSNEVESLGNRYLDLMDQIYRLANIDSLTQLPNREQFLTTVSNTLMHQTQAEFVMFYFDLDRFKQVNDFYGHTEGDLILGAFAKKLEETMNLYLDNTSGRTALISRLAGDEFAAFIELSLLKAPIDEITEDLVKNLNLEFEASHGLFHLEVSIGVALYPEHARSAEDLVAAADEAMFEAKKRGRNRWEILSQKIVDQNNLKKSIQEAIETSISDNLFYLVYQPIFSGHNQALVAAEVLLRSSHSTLMEVGTETFISVAESNGSIRRIDSLVINLAMEKIAEIQARNPSLTLSINFSAAELISRDFPNMLNSSLDNAGVPASAIQLEITETQMTEFGDQALGTLGRLHKMGFSVALDDFGTGYNSFAQLNSNFISHLKIDRRFVEAIHTDTRDAKMVNIILGMAKLYGLKVVAEGVETDQQLAYLRAHQCDYVQGYLFAKPMKWNEFSEFLKTYQG